jgi:hypothetical protein
MDKGRRMTNPAIDRLREEMLHAPAEMDASVVPPRFDEARDHIRAAIERVERAGIPTETLHAVLMSETLPRLIHEHGPLWVAATLAQFSSALVRDAKTGRERHAGNPVVALARCAAVRDQPNAILER